MYWNKKLAKAFLVPTLGREFVLKKAILAMLGPLNGKHIIEFGCGSGYWTRIFHDCGAVCIGIDTSREQIMLAKMQNGRGIKYKVADAATFYSRAKFDIVFIDHVISENSSKKKIERILLNLKSLLKNKGFVIINEMHPSVAHFPFDNMKIPANYFYFKSKTPFTFLVRQLRGHSLVIHDFHWTIGDLSLFLYKTGFLIEKIVEPRLIKNKIKDNHLRLRNRYPAHIVIKATPR